MAYENITLILYAGALLFALGTLIFTVKNREFERGAIENTVNALLFGFFIMLIMLAIRIVEVAEQLAPEAFAELSPNVSTYISYLVQIETLALAPLVAVCFLVAIVLARDLTSKEK